jgi:hypothetical protein
MNHRAVYSATRYLPTHAGRADQLSVDPPVAPGRILRGEPKHQVVDLQRDRRAAACVAGYGQTLAMSIYRKLGVSSRSEAVAKAQALGLLES